MQEPVECQVNFKIFYIINPLYIINSLTKELER